MAAPGDNRPLASADRGARDSIEAAGQATGAFGIGPPARITRHGTGNINDSYRLSSPDGGDYLLQRINQAVFDHPERIARNLERLYAARPDRLPEILRAADGELLHRDAEGEFWRLYRFVSGSRHADTAATPEIAREAGRAFGSFLNETRDLRPADFEDTVPGFHDLRARLGALERAIGADVRGRVRHAQDACAVIERHSGLAAIEFPRDRIAHNDCKISNVLFAADGPRALCVVDLDTVMPGAAGFDFGDLVRSAAARTDENETDAARIGLDLARTEAIAGGFCETTVLTASERESLVDGILHVTFMLAVRFLTDHLDGDRYFRTAYRDHNLDRARNQLALLRDMERRRPALEKVIRAAAKGA
ncbi:MAG: aminoglycoside phosphotransferase family protein [Gammaproteobacteria bacterium]|nr:aminoglycoside phosphotransferase family protein [Gammaproteobacteria bacterium]